MIVVGVDGFQKGWVAVALENGSVCAVEVHRTFGDVLAGFADAAAFAVDIPIGLPSPDTYPRPADVAAREFVGARRASVFATPLRRALLVATFAEACDVNFAATAKKVSQQAFALRTKILELEALAPTDDRIHEAHPEVSFRELAGGELPFPKQSWNGFHLRQELLDQAAIVLPARVDGRAPVLDVLDASAAAWSASRIAAGTGRPLPPGQAGRIGAIWR